ncbi:MAG: response regulator transcription factor [Chitinivibrionales bacterium]|nr:response regulator transcription factor [Chitinivibrionales bacterium]
MNSQIWQSNMAKELIYILEDDEDIAELVAYNLKKEGYQTHTFSRGEVLLGQLNHTVPACVILDLMLPGIDGYEVCKTIRASSSFQHIPIIMLTAKGEESDMVTGLELGADDYLVKPFSPRILMARLKVVLRRDRQKKEVMQKPISINSISIHPGKHEVTVMGRIIDLTASEFRALYLFANKPGWVFTRWQIVEFVHGPNYPVTDRSIDVLVVGLRKKLGSAGDYVETVRGIGYRFKA